MPSRGCPRRCGRSLQHPSSQKRSDGCRPFREIIITPRQTKYNNKKSPPAIQAHARPLPERELVFRIQASYRTDRCPAEKAPSGRPQIRPSLPEVTDPCGSNRPPRTPVRGWPSILPFRQSLACSRSKGGLTPLRPAVAPILLAGQYLGRSAQPGLQRSSVEIAGSADGQWPATSGGQLARIQPMSRKFGQPRDFWSCSRTAENQAAVLQQGPAPPAAALRRRSSHRPAARRPCPALENKGTARLLRSATGGGSPAWPESRMPTVSRSAPRGRPYTARSNRRPGHDRPVSKGCTSIRGRAELRRRRWIGELRSTGSSADAASDRHSSESSPATTSVPTSDRTAARAHLVRRSSPTAPRRRPYSRRPRPADRRAADSCRGRQSAQNES